MALLSGVRRPSRPDPAPLVHGGFAVVALGTALWGVALAALLVVRLTGGDVQTWWIAMCAYGAALGLLGLPWIRRQQRRHPR